MTIDLLKELEACEAKVWDALVLGDPQADSDALDDDFLAVYADGFVGKSDHVGQLAHGPTVTSYHLSNLRVLPLGNDYAVLSYHAKFTRRAKTETMYVSSIWKRTGNGWVNVFSQDTPAID